MKVPVVALMEFLLCVSSLSDRGAAAYLRVVACMLTAGRGLEPLCLAIQYADLTSLPPP